MTPTEIPADALTLAAVGYRYPSGAAPAVQDVTLAVRPGEVVVLTGPTGCGKSTLLRLMAGLLQRHGQGDFAGQLRVAGVDPAQAAPAVRVRLAGFVSQEPGDQLVSGTVGDELAFGMESAGLDPAAIHAELPALLQAVGLAVLSPERSTDALSGGQTQRLVTGAALSAGAGLLLLDEPLAQLDPDGAARLLQGLADLAARRGVAVVMVEHRLEAALQVASRLLVMADGRLLADAPTTDLQPGGALLATLRRLGLTIPGPLDLADRLAPRPLSAVRFALPPSAAPEGAGAVLAEVPPQHHRYAGTEADALAGVGLVLRAGERVALLGGNGAGKSTLLGLLSGRIGAAPLLTDAIAVPQDPDLSLFCATVAEELAYGPRERGLSGDALAARVQAAAEALSIAPLLERAPQALSRGQRLRTAVAAALACRPRVLLLDEPTSGQDHDQIERMMHTLTHVQADGALVFATHDVALALRHATRAVVLHQGRLLADGPPAQVLAHLPPEVPISLPPLAALCQQHGLPLSASPELLADHALPGEAAAAILPPAPPTAQDVPAAPPAAVTWETGLDPRTRLGLLGAAGLLAVSLERPESLGLLAAACALPLVGLRVGWAWWRRGLVVTAALVWGTVLSQGLFYAEQPRVSLGHLGPLHLYREGVVHGLAQSMRFVGLALAGIAVAVSTPPDRMFAALVRLRVPFGLALMAATALRFLPVLGQELLTVRRARAARGRPLWQRAPTAWLAQEVSLLRPVVARAWRRAQNLAESLDARGFDPVAPRTLRRPLRLRAVDGAVLAGALTVSLAGVGTRLLYLLYLSETLYLPHLRPLYGFVRRWL